MHEKLTVRQIKIFDGPRHRRLRAVWDVIAEQYRDVLVLKRYDNMDERLRHGQAYNKMWVEERDEPNRYVLFTEEDFLPRFEWLQTERPLLDDLDVHIGECAGLGVLYSTRNPRSRRLKRSELSAGGWFVLLDKDRCPRDIDFDGRPDPCNDLPEQFPMLLMDGEDAFPLHYGINYPVGTHLFWARHLHDDPDAVVSGFSLGDIQLRHDLAVDDWIAEQSADFTELLIRRFGFGTLIHTPTSEFLGSDAALAPEGEIHPADL